MKLGKDTISRFKHFMQRDSWQIIGVDVEFKRRHIREKDLCTMHKNELKILVVPCLIVKQSNKCGRTLGF